jgi:choline-sulfatase
MENPFSLIISSVPDIINKGRSAVNQARQRAQTIDVNIILRYYYPSRNDGQRVVKRSKKVTAMETKIKNRANVVFILSDDQGPWAAGCYGNEEIRTPNIDRLSVEGLLFENFFCTSPVCSPARASILTGKLPSQHGVHDWIREGNMPPYAAAYLDGMRCYTDILAEQGWQCGLSGKWHLGDSMNPQAGFSHWFCHRKGAGSYIDQPMIRDGTLEQTEGYITDVITDEALRFIDAKKETPFYLSVHYTAPHSPWTGHPEAIVASYDGCRFDSCPQEGRHPWAGPLTSMSYGNREHLKGYFAAVTAMDAAIGRILDKLKQLGLEERTLVIFTSDNGFSCGQHGFWGKGNGTFPMNMYENSVKVPMVVRHTGVIPAGRRTGALMSQYDVFPTLLEYLGVVEVGAYDGPGCSHCDVWLVDSQNEGREDVVVYDEYGPVRMIRTRRWKYIHRYPFGVHELYDLERDPGERQNRIEDQSCGAVVRELRARLSRWFGRFVDPVRDGSRLPISGSGQLCRIDVINSGEQCFSADRIVMGESGFPKVNDRVDLEAFKRAAEISP